MSNEITLPELRDFEVGVGGNVFKVRANGFGSCKESKCHLFYKYREATDDERRNSSVNWPTRRLTVALFRPEETTYIREVTDGDSKD